MMIKYVLLILLIAVPFGGCAKLTHLKQLLTLKAMGDNKDLQDAYVKYRNDQFDKVLAVIKDGKIKEYQDQNSILNDFGDPVYTKRVFRRGETMERWLYRYAVRFKNPEKVYLYFNQSGQLVFFEHRKPKS